MVDKIGLLALANDVVAALTTPASVTTGNITFSGTMLGGRMWAFNAQTYTANTFYQKPANLAFIMVECQGAGGGGGACTDNTAGNFRSGGGGGGAYCRSYFDASELSNSEIVVVGLAGRGGANAQNGLTGGNTYFGNNKLVLAGGGFGGQNVINHTGLGVANGIVGTLYIANGGQGGIAYTGQYAEYGQEGNPGFITASGLGAASRYGSPWDMPTTTINGAAGTASNGWLGSQSFLYNTPPNFYGCGGRGGASTNINIVMYGANGAGGVIIISEYLWPGR